MGSQEVIRRPSPPVQQRRRSGRRGRWSGAREAWRWIGQLLKGEVYYQLRLGN